MQLEGKCYGQMICIEWIAYISVLWFFWTVSEPSFKVVVEDEHFYIGHPNIALSLMQSL